MQGHVEGKVPRKISVPAGEIKAENDLAGNMSLIVMRPASGIAPILRNQRLGTGFRDVEFTWGESIRIQGESFWILSPHSTALG